MEEVWEYGLIWPHLAFKWLRATWHLQEHILVNSLIIRCVALSLSNSRVEDWNEFHIHIVEQVIDVITDVSKVNWVSCKVSILVHVVNISPLSF